MMNWKNLTLFCWLAGAGLVSANDAIVISSKLVHLRHSGEREWSTFPEGTPRPELSVPFKAAADQGASTLQLRQQDVKQGWNVELNGKVLGKLTRDENDQQLLLPVILIG